jgi:hypothetical protein
MPREIISLQAGQAGNQSTSFFVFGCRVYFFVRCVDEGFDGVWLGWHEGFGEVFAPGERLAEGCGAENLKEDSGKRFMMTLAELMKNLLFSLISKTRLFRRYHRTTPCSTNSRLRGTHPHPYIPKSANIRPIYSSGKSSAQNTG